MNDARNQSRYRDPPARVSAATAVSREDLRAIEQRARQLRARAVNAALRTVGRTLKGSWRAFRDGLSRLQMRRQAVAELARLDDRMLRDIGIERGQIPYVVDQLLQTGTSDHRTRSPRVTATTLRTVTGARALPARDQEARRPRLAA